MIPTPWLPKPLPWEAPDYTDDVVMSVRALVEGKANAAQQQMVWRYLMYLTKGSDEFQDLSFRPSSPKTGMQGEATIFAEGSRFIGMMLRKLLRPECTPRPSTPSPSLSIQKRLRARRTERTAV